MMAAQTKTPALGFDTAPGLPEIHREKWRIPMRNLRNRAPVRNHHDLPLFRFATRLEDLRRMSYADRRILERGRLLCPSTARLYADILGFTREDV
jgi:hypothetical protein